MVNIKLYNLLSKQVSFARKTTFFLPMVTVYNEIKYFMTNQRKVSAKVCTHTDDSLRFFICILII